MGRRRGWLKRLEQRSQQDLVSFALVGGGRFYHDPTLGVCYLHAVACFRAQQRGEPFPEPPEPIKALTSVAARDRGAALEQVAGDSFPYDRQALIERGELVPRSMVTERLAGE